MIRVSFFLVLFSFLLTQTNSFAQYLPKSWQKYGGKRLIKKPRPKPYFMPHFVYTENSSRQDTTHYFKRLDVYRYDSLHGKLDSTRTAQLWYADDTTVAENSGRFYEWIPFTCSADNVESIVSTNKGYATYETCDPLTCEAGLRSGYNKYVIHYNASRWADTVLHLTDEYSDGKGGVNLHPTYNSLSERYVFTYATNKETIETYNDRQELIERLIRHFDAQGRLVVEERLHPAEYKTKEVGIKIWYHYPSP